VRNAGEWAENTQGSNDKTRNDHEGILVEKVDGSDPAMAGSQLGDAEL
jgi:hypothetical protein